MKSHFGCFALLSVEAFKQFYTKRMYFSFKIFSFFVNRFCLHEMSVVCPEHTVMPDKIVLVGRVLHFNASSLKWKLLLN